MNDILFIITLAVSAVASYLLGGINGAILLSGLVYHQDIRTLGSKNPGFTNFKRVYGLNGTTWAVMLLDMLKAVVPVFITAITCHYAFNMWQFGAAFSGLFCMIGHCFPIWYGFKGGKAFITGAATLCFVDWRVALIALVLFLLMLFTVKIMSVCSCTAALFSAVAVALFGAPIYVTVVSALSALLVIVRHYGNFKKLLRGEETKFSLKSKLGT